ncbi:hypothetical protein [Actinomadura geliboluensis]|uniref:hypothetical protein n=1 Tax=Actinomadura geliboluensis TaxID=882440 RepID=UPI0037110D19
MAGTSNGPSRRDRAVQDTAAFTATPVAAAVQATARHRRPGGRPDGNTRHSAANPARFHTHAPSFTA